MKRGLVLASMLFAGCRHGEVKSSSAALVEADAGAAAAVEGAASREAPVSDSENVRWAAEQALEDGRGRAAKSPKAAMKEFITAMVLAPGGEPLQSEAEAALSELVAANPKLKPVVAEELYQQAVALKDEDTPRALRFLSFAIDYSVAKDKTQAKAMRLMQALRSTLAPDAGR